MRTDVDGHRAKVFQVSQQRLSVSHGGVVSLVVTEPGIDRFVLAKLAVQIDGNCSWLPSRILRCGRYNSLRYRSGGSNEDIRKKCFGIDELQSKSSNKLEVVFECELDLPR